MSDLIMDDYSNVTVKIEENVVIKEDVYDSDDSYLNLSLSEFIPDERGNVVEFYDDGHRFIKPEPIEAGPPGSSNIGDSGLTVGRVKSRVCLKCDKTLSSKSHLNRHMKSVHDKFKKCSCGECGRAFSQQGNLKVHVEAVHGKLKKFSCEECDRAFAAKGALKEHVNAIHRNLSNYSCGKCDRSFSLKHGLNRHLAVVHEKLKNYVCAECSRSFGHRSTLIVHLKKIHAA